MPLRMITVQDNLADTLIYGECYESPGEGRRASSQGVRVRIYSGVI
jgi:hypothetical protein